MRRLSFAVTCMLLTTASVAQAYVLPADFVLRMVAERRRDLRIEDLSLQLHTERDGELPTEERLYLKFPERLRLVDTAVDGVLYVEREGRWARGTDKELKVGQGLPPELLATLLAPKGKDIDAMSARLLERLQKAGVDTSVTALGRFDERPAYIIGARPWEPDKPQVWVDKESFLPVRIILHRQHRDRVARVDTRLLEYGSSTAGNWFPRVIEVYVDDALSRRAEVTRAQVNQDLPETLFDIP